MAIPFLDLVERIDLHPQILIKRVSTGELPAHRPNPKNRATWSVEEEDFENYIRSRLFLANGDDLEETVKSFFSEDWKTTDGFAQDDKEQGIINKYVNQGLFSYVDVAFQGAQKHRYRFAGSGVKKIKKLLAERRRFWKGDLFYVNHNLALNLGYSSEEELVENTPKKYLRKCVNPQREFYITKKGHEIMLSRHQERITAQAEKQERLLEKLKDCKTTTDYRETNSVSRAAAWAAFNGMHQFQQRLQEQGYELPPDCEMVVHQGRLYMPQKLFQRMMKVKRHYQRYWIQKWLEKNSKLKPS
ncbi:MAG: hypothetical protein KAT77_03845 [Nanoarchaeota archaeon]|nr:hypothetical protein [Nanoarchaeota archaeon]